MTALHWGVYHGFDRVVTLLLEAGADIESQNARGFTAIHFAAWNGSVKVMRILLDWNADMQACTETQETALHLAARKNHYDTVALLVERGASIQSVNKQGLTPLQCAKDKEIVMFLRDHEQQLYAQGKKIAIAEKNMKRTSFFERDAKVC